MMRFLPLAALLAALPVSPGAAQGNPGSPSEITRIREQLLALPPGVETARRLEAMVRATWRSVPLDGVLVGRLQQMARAPGGDPRVRRYGLAALLAAQQADSATLRAALASGDEQLRRLSVTGLPRLSPGERGTALTGAAGDPSPMVRLEALRALARADGGSACPRLTTGAADPVPAVALVALDLLGGCPGEAAASRVLLEAATAASPTWHRRAHALVSLARVAPQQAAVLLPGAAGAAVWEVRMYAARAALVLGDRPALERLAGDSVANVREAAVAGLSQVAGHGADSLYRAALAARDYQLVLGAAKALDGTPAPAEAASALLAAFTRITRERSETSRDTRVALLVRLRQLGAPADSIALAPALGDFDPVVAESAAAVLSSWTGRPALAVPVPLPPDPVPAGEARALQGARLVFTMASGRSFEVALYPDSAPRTVARMVRLVRQRYYDGLTFHRVVPNFVVQGGSPGANEYAGHPRFMADELTGLAHERGTLGISTRGRDTGDAQLFINLVDNPRLDHEYTVWGRVTAGMATVDGILEGDAIRRVEIRPR